MTVVIGLLGSDGAVIGADTQLTAGNIKATATKVVAATSGDHPGAANALAIGGAGDYGYFQAVRVKLSMAILQAMIESESSHLPFDTHIVENSIKAVLLPFYVESVMPFYVCPEEDRPDIFTISALWANGHGSLWATDKMSVRPVVGGYDSVGYGAALAGEYLHGLYRANAPMDIQVLLATYVIWHVKRLLNLVGHETEIVVVGNSFSEHLHPDFIHDLEKMFTRYVAAQAKVFDFISGLADGQEATGELRKLRAEFDQMRQAIRSISSRSSQA